MRKYLTKRNLYIGLFGVLYFLVGIVSLMHSFAFFGLANNSAMSVMLGCCFEIGQVAVLMSLLTSKKEQGRMMPWVLMVICTIVQIMGNVFSSYKYIMQNSIADLVYFKQPVFVWTDLPDDVTTVIVTYIVGGILPIIALCMTGMVSNYLMDEDPDDNKQIALEEEITENDDVEEKKESESEDTHEEAGEDAPGDERDEQGTDEADTQDVKAEDEDEEEGEGVEDEHIEDKAVENKFIEDKPVEDKPIEDKPIEDKPIEDKPKAHFVNLN